MSQAVAQRDTSRRQPAEETARDRLRTTLLTGTPEREGVQDVAGRAKRHFPDYHPAGVDGRAGATPSDKKDDRPRKASSMREVPDDTRMARRKAQREPQHVALNTPQSKATVPSFERLGPGHPQSPLQKVPEHKRKATAPSLEHLGGPDHPQSPLQKVPEHKRKATAPSLEHLGGTDHPQSPLQKVPEHKRKATAPSFEHLRRQEAHAEHETVPNRKRIYCGNNALAHELTSGQAVVGKRYECFRKGVGGGLHAKIPPGGLEEFIKKWTAPYRKIVEQPLHYGDGPTPADKIPATLSQCLARGFAVGSIQKAKKEMRNAE